MNTEAKVNTTEEKIEIAALDSTIEECELMIVKLTETLAIPEKPRALKDYVSSIETAFDEIALDARFMLSEGGNSDISVNTPEFKKQTKAIAATLTWESMYRGYRTLILANDMRMSAEMVQATEGADYRIKITSDTDGTTISAIYDTVLNRKFNNISNTRLVISLTFVGQPMLTTSNLEDFLHTATDTVKESRNRLSTLKAMA